MCPLYLSTSCWLVSTLSSGREEERVRDNTVIQKNYENVPPVPVHLLLVGVDPVLGQSKEEREKEIENRKV